MKIALATSVDLPESIEDDRILRTRLLERGHEATYCVWDDADIDWATFDLVIIRTCWDYSLRINEFLEWIGRLEANDVTLLNPPATVRRNTDKQYLLEIADKGVSIPDSQLLQPESPDELIEAVRAFDHDSIVIKPCVSASARHTFLLHRPLDTDLTDIFTQIADRGKLLLQRFVSEIQTTGEYSMIYFGGAFSHAVCKRPKSGDFRVQAKYGGSIESVQPAPELIKAGLSAINQTGKAWTYARVDIVPIVHTALVMELELVEPELFFSYDGAAADNFINALGQQVTSSRFSS